LTKTELAHQARAVAARGISRNLRGYPHHDSFTLLSFFAGWVGGFLKTASALGCGILHPDPKEVSFEWMSLDNNRYRIWRRYLDLAFSM
jgi:hypothetical protein